MSDVAIQENVVVGKGGERDLKVDVFSARTLSIPVPGLLFLPGGGWRNADRALL